jgi:hypothetical protein
VTTLGGFLSAARSVAMRRIKRTATSDADADIYPVLDLVVRQCKSLKDARNPKPGRTGMGFAKGSAFRCPRICDMRGGGLSIFVYCNIGESIMAIFATSLVLAAAGYSLLYLLFGGGLGGAVLIFIVAKMLGK